MRQRGRLGRLFRDMDQIVGAAGQALLDQLFGHSNFMWLEDVHATQEPMQGRPVAGPSRSEFAWCARPDQHRAPGMLAVA